MKIVFRITYELSKALQQNDQDIVNAMKLVKFSKYRLQAMRDDGWNSLLNEVYAFCAKNNIVIHNMNDLYQSQAWWKAQGMKKIHHYLVKLYYTVIDMQLKEL
jgi:hypothetical protein